MCLVFLYGELEKKGERREKRVKSRLPFINRRIPHGTFGCFGCMSVEKRETIKSTDEFTRPFGCWYVVLVFVCVDRQTKDR